METMFILIIIAQIVAHLLDNLTNDGRNVGLILMVTIVCHILNRRLKYPKR